MTSTLIVRFFAFTLLLLEGCAKSGSEAKQVETPPLPSAGEQIFAGNCKVCHAQGINGAPIVGNKKMWQSRVAQGIPVLVQHAMNGYGLMPAKGGKQNLTEEQITEAVTYMVSRAGE